MASGSMAAVPSDLIDDRVYSTIATEGNWTFMWAVSREHSVTENQMSALPTAEALTRTDRPITTVLELCLYRVVTVGRILPFGVRQIIMDYAFVKFDNNTLREAVQLWCGQRAVALQQYGDINDWDVSKVTDMSRLFQESMFNDRIDRWDVRNVASIEGMFDLADRFNQPLDTWDVSRVTSMKSLFSGAFAFNQPLACWNVSQVTNMNNMFSGASSFNQPLSTWDVSRVTDMADLFYFASSFNQPLGMWDVRQVIDMSFMFHGASSFNQPLATWDVRCDVNRCLMFEGATSFQQTLPEAL